MSQRPTHHEPSAVLTSTAAARLREELERLKTDGRQHMAERLQHARELGDIRENAEYDAAKNEQGLMEARIRQLERLLKDVQLVEGPGHSDHVDAGMLVTLRPVEDAEAEEETYLLAHSKEERAKGARTVTTESPLGSLIVGRGVGDRVTVSAPGGEFTYEVVSFELHTG
jgi:transcription elongation factor GreA